MNAFWWFAMGIGSVGAVLLVLNIKRVVWWVFAKLGMIHIQ